MLRLRFSHAIALVVGTALVGCGDEGPPSGPAPARVPSEVVVLSRNPQPGVAAHRMPDSVVVRVLDQAGEGVGGVSVRFTAGPGGGVLVPSAVFSDARGYAAAQWRLGGGVGEQTAVAEVTGLQAAQLRADVRQVAAPMAGMLAGLGDYTRQVRVGLELAAPNNPQSARFFQLKIAMLGDPMLVGNVIAESRFIAGEVRSTSGRLMPIAALYPLASLREETTALVARAEGTIQVLEAFIGLPFPSDTLRIWNGFELGSSGGGGQLRMEDRATYEERTGPTRMPYEAIVVHEFAHSYISQETLTQFLELYAHNLQATGSAQVGDWTHTRGYVPDQPGNAEVHALLDIYRLVGRDAMAAAYRAIIAHRPLYGQPLTDAARNAFVQALPAAARAEAAEKFARVGT